MKLLSALALAFALARPVHAADLVQVYREALANDAAYAAARAAYQAGLERLPQGRAGLLPAATLSGNANRSHLDTNLAPGRDFNTYGYTLSLSQPVYRKQNFVAFEQAKLQINQVEAQLASAQQDLILRVAQAYFDVLLAQDNVALSEAQKAAIAEQLAQAKRNFEVGTATITDTHEAQARVDLATAKEISDQNDLEIRKRALQLIIGKMPEALAPLKEQLTLPLPEPNDMDQWVAASEQDNLQVRVQKAAAEIAVQEIERNKAGHLPTLDLVASYTDTRNAATAAVGVGIDSKSSLIGLQLNLSLYAGGLTSSRVREAVANQDRAQQDLENTRRNVALTTRQAFLGVTNGVAQVKALEAALVSSQSQLDSTELGQEVGVRTAVDVLNAQQQLFQARRDLFQARYNTILNQLRLKAATGALAEGDLVEIGRHLGQ